MKKKSLFLALTSMFMLASCGSDELDIPEEEVLITGVRLSSESLELTVGDKEKAVNYNVLGHGNFSKEVTVYSEDATIATAAKVEGKTTFKVAPVGEGETKVIVKSTADEKISASLSVKVNKQEIIPEKPHVTGLYLDKDSARMDTESEGVSFTVTITGEGNYDVGYIVNVEQPDIVEVSATEGVSGSSFVVTPKAAGTALIDVISKADSKFTKQIQILVDPKYVPVEEDSLCLSDLLKSIEIGDSFYLGVKEKVGEGAITWSIDPSDSNIISLSDESDEGVTVNALNYGVAKVVGQFGNAEPQECVVTVEDSQNFKGYSVKVNGGEEITLDKVSEAPSYVVEQYIASFDDLKAGDVIDFFGKTKVGLSSLPNVGPNADDFTNLKQNNLKGSAEDSTVFVVQQDLTKESNLYFEVYNDHYGFWLEGGPELAVAVPMLVGLGDEWSTGLKMSKNPNVEEKPNEYMIKDVSLETTDQFKFKYEGHGQDGDDLWAGYNQIQEGRQSYFNDVGGDDHNISVKEAGKYDFYWDLYAGIWAEKVVEPLPEYTDFRVDVGGIPVPLEKKEVTPEGMIAQYTASITGNSGLEVEFYGTVDGVESKITSHIGPNPDNFTDKIQNNIKPSTEGGVDFKILKSCTDATLYFEVYEDGFGFWLEGGPAVLEGFYLKVNNDPIYSLGEGTPWDFDPSFTQYTVLGVEFEKDDVIQLYDASTKASWMCTLESGGANEHFEEGDNCLTVKDAGKYDFYVKMKSGQDSIFISETPSTDPKISFAQESYTVGVGKEISITVDLENCGDVTPVFSITEGLDYAEIVSSTGNVVVLSGQNEGEAALKASVYVGENELTATAKIYVCEENIQTFYFSNNKGFTSVYMYAFGAGNAENAAWPGEKLSKYSVNKEGEDIYSFSVDLNTYQKFIINNGEADDANVKTRDIEFNEFVNGNNNVYLLDTTAEGGGLNVDFAKYSLIQLSKDSVTIQEGATNEITIYSALTNLNFEIDNDSVATISDTSDAGFKVNALSEGKAKVHIYHGEKASCDAETYLDVEVVEKNVKTVYFHNSYTSWTNFSLYLFKSGTEVKNATFPGVEFSGDTVEDELVGDCYAVELDLNTYDSFIICGKEGGETKQSRDVEIASLGEYNLVQFNTGEGTWIDVGGGKFVADVLFSTFTLEQEHEFKVSIDEEEAVKMDLDDTNLPDGVKHQYSTGASIDAGAGLEFIKDGEPFTNIVLDPALDNNAYIQDDGDIIVKCSYEPEGDHKSMYLKLLSDGTYSLYVAGYEPEVETVEFTLNCAESWMFSLDVKVFIWAWGESSSGAWYAADFTACAPNQCKVTLPADTIGFKVVRAHISTSGNPKWDVDKYVYEGDGTIYNETDNIDVISGTTSYPISEMHDFVAKK